MGELERIEAAYGSVAEYNRVMSEEYEYDDYGNLVPREEYEPTEEELQKMHEEHVDFQNMLKYLNGDIDEDSQKLYTEIYSHEPKREDFDDYNEYVRAGYKFGDDKYYKVVEFVEAKYGVKFDVHNNVYRMGIDKFGIEISWSDCGRVYHPALVNMDYDLFSRIFRDLHYFRMSPTFFYQRLDGKGDLYASNVSLGDIRYSYISGQGKYPSMQDLLNEWEKYKNIMRTANVMQGIADKISGGNK